MKRALWAVLTSGVIACAAPPPATPAPVLVAVPPPSPVARTTPRPRCPSRLEEAEESYPLAAREFDRASGASPVIAAHVFAAIPQLFVDVSDSSWRPPFVADYTSRLAELPREGDRIVLSPALLGRVRALGRPATSAKGGEAQARTLRLLIDAPPAAFTSGTRSAETAVTPSLVNRTALAAFAVSGLTGQDRASRDFFERRKAEPASDEEAALLWPDDVSDFRSAPQKHAVYNPARLALFQRWIAEVRHRIAGPPDAASAKLVADRMFALGIAAPRFGLTAEVRALATEILARKGDLPLVRGQREWARTIAAAAAAARYDVDHPANGYYTAPHLYSFDEGHEHGFDLLRAELAERPDEAALATRVAEVDAELAHAQHDAARCYLLNERAWATPAREADAYFDALLAPVLAGPRIDLRDNAGPLCRVEAALSMRTIAPQRRAQTLVRLLADREALAGGACVQVDTFTSGYSDRNELAFGLIADHAGLVDASAELRAWLFANGSGTAYETWIFNSTERVYRRAFAHATPSEAAAAKRLVRAWIDDAHEDHSHDRERFAIEHVVALAGAYASELGLAAAARSLYAGMKPDDEPRSRAVGMALLDLESAR